MDRLTKLLRPHTTVVLAMSVDGKIGDYRGSAARFGSAADRDRVEAEIARADATLFGAATLRAYGTTLPVSNPQLLRQRQQQGKPSQPVQIVVSRQAQFDRHWRFFSQPVPRWLLTGQQGARAWLDGDAFERILIADAAGAPREPPAIDWSVALPQFVEAGIERIAVLGGGQLVASLLAVDAIDELKLTLCPILLGGISAPSPLAGLGFLAEIAPRLHLLSVKLVGEEVFLHYCIKRV